MYYDSTGHAYDTYELRHHGILGMKWGIRRYQNKDGTLTEAGRKRLYKNTKLSKYATDIYYKAKKKEPKITNDVTNSITNTSAKMYGLENRLKTVQSLDRKIKTDSIEKHISISDSAKDIKDAIRYTAISNDKDFVNNYDSIKKSLKQKGYDEIRCKNYFELYNQGKVKHKSVQSVFRDKDGTLFEIQFQTPSSQKAKNDKIPLYEEIRKPGVSDKRRKQLERAMTLLAEKVSTPDNINKIKTY